jgi:hypothetical protein
MFKKGPVSVIVRIVVASTEPIKPAPEEDSQPLESVWKDSA